MSIRPASLADSRAVFLLAGVVLVAGCGKDDDDDAPCDPSDPDACAGPLVCEEVDGGEPGCFAPVVVSGRVFDIQTDDGIEGATVVALDSNGFAQSGVEFSDEFGLYELRVAAVRGSDGLPIQQAVTLRADAEGYLTFPLAPRLPIPIDLDGAVEGSGDEPSSVVENAATDIALLPSQNPDRGVIFGEIEGFDVFTGGALVVAEQGGVAVSTAVADRDGEFILFNVPPGTTVVDAYGAGLNVEAESIDVEEDTDANITLSATTDDGLVTVSGSLQIVNAPGGLTTSVVLGVESTFNELFVRAESPPGLRAENVGGAFEIPDVPPGDYVVLVAFENDQLVRDPDEGISGTDIVRISVDGSGDVVLDQSFKVTEALEIFSPGADGVEIVSSADLTLQFDRDSSEDGYEVRLYDAYGNVIWEELNLPPVTGSGPVEVEVDGSGLFESGGIYQYRAWSWRDRDGRTYISATEDFRGAFQYQP